MVFLNVDIFATNYAPPVRASVARTPGLIDWLGATEKSGTYLTKHSGFHLVHVLLLPKNTSARRREEAASRQRCQFLGRKVMHISDTAISPKDLAMLQSVLDAVHSASHLTSRGDCGS